MLCLPSSFVCPVFAVINCLIKLSAVVNCAIFTVFIKTN